MFANEKRSRLLEHGARIHDGVTQRKASEADRAATATWAKTQRPESS